MPALIQSEVEPSNMEEAEDGRENIREEKQENSDSHTPLVAVPEKIVLCIDVSEDYIFKPYILSNDNTCNPFLPLKNCVINFVRNKHTLNELHEFAVMSVEPGAVKWVHDFSSNPEEIINAINGLEVIQHRDPLDVDITPVFKEIKGKVVLPFGRLPKVRNSTVHFPTHIIRLILIYNSSYNIPIFDNSDEHLLLLTSSNYFIWDVLFLHDAPSRENKCQEIYDALLNVSSPGSYIFESSRKIVKLYNTMAKLLAHPLQRFEQPFIKK
ncbi:BRISC and BRCA1-A complex member 1-like [Lycorma delicatula]|uniref:BRISC and BRCA1-A complex member 1-like n=1 Tax=Lycorma delicatula TaxID=130591 RepID=UPI003F5160C7